MSTIPVDRVELDLTDVDRQGRIAPPARRSRAVAVREVHRDAHFWMYEGSKFSATSGLAACLLGKGVDLKAARSVYAWDTILGNAMLGLPQSDEGKRILAACKIDPDNVKASILAAIDAKLAQGEP